MPQANASDLGYDQGDSLFNLSEFEVWNFRLDNADTNPDLKGGKLDIKITCVPHQDIEEPKDSLGALLIKPLKDKQETVLDSSKGERRWKDWYHLEEWWDGEKGQVAKRKGVPVEDLSEVSRFNHIGSNGKWGPPAEMKDYRTLPALERLRLMAPKTKFKKIFAFELGSLSPNYDVEVPWEQHQIVYETAAVLETWLGEGKKLEVILHDWSYSSTDLERLPLYFGGLEHSKVSVKNRGIDWEGLLDEGCLIITFTPRSPFRQLLAGIMLPVPSTKMPRAIICPLRDYESTAGDKTSKQVVGFLRKYEVTGPGFPFGRNKIVGLHIRADTT